MTIGQKANAANPRETLYSFLPKVFSTQYPLFITDFKKNIAKIHINIKMYCDIQLLLNPYNLHTNPTKTTQMQPYVGFSQFLKTFCLHAKKTSKVFLISKSYQVASNVLVTFFSHHYSTMVLVFPPYHARRKLTAWTGLNPRFQAVLLLPLNIFLSLSCCLLIRNNHTVTVLCKFTQFYPLCSQNLLLSALYILTIHGLSLIILPQ